jgi:hypothetical protein
MGTTPRLMVICLGGLAGAGALVCCDLDEGLESPESDSEAGAAEEADLIASEGEPSAVQ